MTQSPPYPVKVDTNDDVSDEDLVEAARRALPGDHRHFEILIKRHQASILANCRFLVGPDDSAEDLAQEVLIKTFFALGGFQMRSRFKTWVQQIKVNHCLDHLRRDRGRVLLDLDDSAVETVIANRAGATLDPSGLEPNPSLSLVRSVISSLPDPVRIPLVMCDADGYSYQEIADELGLGLSATKMRVKRAREEFRRLYQLRKKNGQ